MQSTNQALVEPGVKKAALLWGFSWKEISFIGAGYLVMRLIYSLLGYIVAWRMHPVAAWTGHPIFETHSVTAPDWGWWSNALINVWYRWDTGWYLKIAAYGYSPSDGSIIFPPLYPLLIRWLAPIFNWNYLFAGLVLSNIFALVALFLFYGFIKYELPLKDSAQLALVIWLAFPTAFYLYAGYSESLFVTLALSAWSFGRRRQWIWAGICAGLAALTRLQGWLLLFPLSWLALFTSEGGGLISPLRELELGIRLFFSNTGLTTIWQRFRAGGWAVVLLPPIAMAGYLFWTESSGLGSVSQAYASVWDMTVVMPWEGARTLVSHIIQGPIGVIDAIDLGLFSLFFVLCLLGSWRLRPAYSLYNWANLTLMMMRGYSAHLMAGFMRYFLVFFPIFLLLSAGGQKRWVRYTLITVFLVLQLLLVWTFLNWYWVA